MVLLVAVFAAIFALTVVVSGEAAFLIPTGILTAIMVAAAWVHRWLGLMQLRRHGGDAAAARADNTDPFPSTSNIPGDVRPAGDSPELHDELNPHDVPVWDRPTREAAEAQAGAHETAGNVEGAAGGPVIAAPVEDRTRRRTKRESARRRRPT